MSFLFLLLLLVASFGGGYYCGRILKLDEKLLGGKGEGPAKKHKKHHPSMTTAKSQASSKTSKSAESTAKQDTDKPKKTSK